MEILVVGTEADFNTLQTKFSEQTVHFAQDYGEAQNLLEKVAVAFDFFVEESPENLEFYAQNPSVQVFINIPKTSLSELYHLLGDFSNPIFGFNGLPTFLERDILEVSALSTEQHEALKSLCEELSTDYEIVEDRVGMVTPRIIFMIINEAFYTVQEGTASRDDIDTGMKLGTNYPYGPFEWLAKIGIEHVYEVLEALYDDTKEERYKICPLLKKEYLLAMA